MGGEVREGMGVEVRGLDGEEGRIKWTPLVHKSWRRACMLTRTVTARESTNAWLERHQFSRATTRGIGADL
jgi:hypothetical protein